MGGLFEQLSHADQQEKQNFEHVVLCICSWQWHGGIFQHLLEQHHQKHGWQREGG